MASGSFSSSSYNGLSLYVEWSSAKNISANTSSVTATVYVKSYGLRASALSDSYIIINGDKKNWTKTFNIADTSILQTTEAITYTVDVPHNTDGTKSITIKANMEFNGTYGGTYVSDITASKTVNLDTIPRSSSFSIPSSVNTGSSLDISITPSSSSFKHKVRFEIDSTTKYTSGFIAAGTNSYSYTIPHSWLPSSTSATMTVYLYTYTGSATSDTDYIARISKTITVNVPSSVKPSVSSVETTLIDGLGGKYVQGKSKIKLVATATAGSGSTINSYIFKGTNIYGTSSSYTGVGNTKTSSIIQSSGTIQYKVAAKDTRGRISDYYTVSINVYAYAAPQITYISAQRCLSDGTINNDGTYAKVTIKSSYVSIDGANTRTVKLYNSKDNYASGTTILTSSDTANTYTGVYGSEFITSTSYTIKATIEDAYNNHSGSTELRVSERIVNIAKSGNGIAIGGLSTVETSDAGKFECNWTSYLNKSSIMTSPSTDSYRYEVRRMQSDGNYIRGQLYIGDGGASTVRELHYNSTSGVYDEGAGLHMYKDFASLEVGGTNLFRVFKNNAVYGTSARIFEPLTVNGNIMADKEIYTNGKTDAYDGKQGVCVGNNGRIYLVGTTAGETGAISPYSSGVVFAYNRSTKGTASILELSSGVLTVNGTLNATISSTSDERIKKDFQTLDKFEEFYNDLNPCCFKMKSDDERYHIGFVAQQVEQSLKDNGLTKDDFGALDVVPYEGDIDESSEDCIGRYKDTGIEKGQESYELVYNEFIALNTYMIQKLKSENETLKSEITILKEKLDLVLLEIEQLKGE